MKSDIGKDLNFSENCDFRITGLPNLHTREKLFNEIAEHHTTDTAAKSTPEIKWGGVW